MGLLDKYPHGKDTYLFGFGLSIETHCNEIQYVSDMLYAEIWRMTFELGDGLYYIHILIQINIIFMII